MSFKSQFRIGKCEKLFLGFLLRVTLFLVHKYIVGSRGASQLGLVGIPLGDKANFSITKLPSCYNKNTCLMLIITQKMISFFR